MSSEQIAQHRKTVNRRPNDLVKKKKTKSSRHLHLRYRDSWPSSLNPRKIQDEITRPLCRMHLLQRGLVSTKFPRGILNLEILVHEIIWEFQPNRAHRYVESYGVWTPSADPFSAASLEIRHFSVCQSDKQG